VTAVEKIFMHSVKIITTTIIKRKRERSCIALFGTHTFHEAMQYETKYLYFSISSSIRNSDVLSLVHRMFLLRIVIRTKVINSSRNRGRFILKNSALSIHLRYYTKKM